MQEFIQYHTLMQNDSVESFPQILEEKYVCVHDLESLQNVVSYAFEDYAMHKMITVLVYVRSSENDILLHILICIGTVIIKCFGPMILDIKFR